MNESKTAYHEAGHAVAHIRLGVLQSVATIIPRDGTLGAVSAEGKKHVYDTEEAETQVLSYCAGYAALIAAGYDERMASAGADGDDFVQAAELITAWSLDGSLDEWKSRSVELMSKAENIRAVEFVAEALMKHKTLDADYIDVLIDRADGNTSEEEWQQYIEWRYPGMV